MLPYSIVTPALLSRFPANHGKYGGNNVLAAVAFYGGSSGEVQKYSTNESATSAPLLFAMRVAALSTFFIRPSR